MIRGRLTVIALATAFILVVSTMGFLFLQKSVAGSSSLSTCLDLNDVNTGASESFCSTETAFGLSFAQSPSLSSEAIAPNGKNFTIYNSDSNTSMPVSRSAFLNLAITEGTLKSVTTNCVTTLTVDTTLRASNSSKATYSTSTPNNLKVCTLSRDGRILETQDFAQGNMTHLLIWAVSGDYTMAFTNGVVIQRHFSGVIGNLTVQTTQFAPQSSSDTISIITTSVTVGGNNLPQPSFSSIPEGAVTGETQNAIVVSDIVPSSMVTATVADTTSYVEQTNHVIQTSVGSATTPVSVGGETLQVSACQVGSCSYSPNTDGTATVAAIVTREDVAIYERDSQQILNMFEAKTVNDLTPYSRCAYFLQC